MMPLFARKDKMRCYRNKTSICKWFDISVVPEDHSCRTGRLTFERPHPWTNDGSAVRKTCFLSSYIVVYVQKRLHLVHKMASKWPYKL